MLIEFSVKNFLSFKDKVTLSMEKGNGDENPDNVVIENGTYLLKTAAIYGANASGKSNILSALSCAILMVRNSNLIPVGGKWNFVKPFLFDEVSRNEPSEFEFIFTSNGVKYRYSFSTDMNRIYDEVLDAYYSQKPTNIFTRKNTNSYEGLPLYESMIYCIASTSLWLCDKKMLLDIGGFEDTPSKQDLLLMVKIISNGYKIMCVKEVLVNYLEHNKGKISTTEANTRIVEGYETLRNYCEKYYYKLSKKHKKDVKFRFSRTLCLQYIGLNYKIKALNKLIEMFILKPLKVSNIKMLLRLIGI